MMGGYAGKMLFVDLTSGTIREEELSQELARNFIGGYGIGAKVLYDMMKPGADPLGPDNVLGFITGPVTGTSAYFSSRYTVVCKSPVTGGWNDANSGGYFGPELKKAGYDAVFVSGAAKEPVYIWIQDGKAEIRDARHLWGKDCKETISALIEETGEPKLRASVIGQSGEKMSLMACPINDGHRAPGRGGGGAVMGSKKLKAIAVRGTGEVAVADPERIKEINRAVIDNMKNGPIKQLLAQLNELGTGFGTPGSALSGDSPVKNWDGIGVYDFGDEAAKGLGSAELDKQHKVKKYACYHCPLGCGAEYDVKTGRWPIGQTERPEYETAAAFGSLLLNSDADVILKTNDICNRYGLDTISTGATVAWAMECYEQGVLSKQDLDGIELTWGNGEAIVAITEKIANQEGCGAVLAHGSAAAAKKWGKGAEYLITVQGIELGMHDPKLCPGYARTYQFDPTPGRHVKGGLAGVQLFYELLGASAPDKYDYSATGEMDVIMTANTEMTNSSGLCMLLGFCAPETAQNDFIEAVTGWSLKPEDNINTGKRILNMRHAFNLREGQKPADCKISPRAVGKPPQTKGPVANVTVDNDLTAKNFFNAVNWDMETGKPTLESLKQLGGLDAVIKELYGDAAS